LSGSVPTGDVVQNMDLSLRDAIERALKYNLALVQGNENTAISRAQRLRALSLLLPNLNLRPSITEQQVNLAAFGLTIPGFPSVVGPFHLLDARGFMTEQFGLAGVRNLQSSRQSARATDLSLRYARDQVVAFVVQLYLQGIAASARIDAARAQVETAQTLYNQALDRKNAGTVPAIDVLRAQVELQTEQQRLIVYEGDFEKRKLALARAIGLPTGQVFRLVDAVPYVPLPAGITLEHALAVAYKTRSDYQAAEALVQAAALAVSGARAERLPSAAVSADYGVNGLQLDRLHGSFAVAAGVNIPLFQGGRIRANVEEASAALRERQAQREDLRGRIDADVRTAFIDLGSASRQVEVSRSNMELARQQVTQSQDRFNAGVTNNVEVVQAQDALAVANENYIAALYAFNAAKAALSRARGDAEESILQFLNTK
jgi:outer membrane protein TolC